MKLNNLHKRFTPKELAKILIDLYQNSNEDAMILAVFVKSQIPMYNGELNPKYKFWDEVTKILMPNSDEKMQKDFIKELISIDNPSILKNYKKPDRDKIGNWIDVDKIENYAEASILRDILVKIKSRKSDKVIVAPAKYIDGLFFCVESNNVIVNDIIGWQPYAK